jgi:hypothetical protein
VLQEGICYIETMQLDGETNLKIKKALDETKVLRHASIADFRGLVHCEPPNSRLYQFTGNLELQPPLVATTGTLSLSPASMLLRGCSLRNTHRIYGLVIYAGALCCCVFACAVWAVCVCQASPPLCASCHSLPALKCAVGLWVGCVGVSGQPLRASCLTLPASLALPAFLALPASLL